MAPISPLSFNIQNPPVSKLGAVSLGASGGSPSGNPFAPSSKIEGETTGINKNIGIGDTVNLVAQAGKGPGVGRTIGIA